MELIIQMIGMLGMILVLLAFTFLKLNKITHKDLIYNLLNLVGSLFLAVSAIYTKSYPLVILNSIWVVFSLIDIIKKK